MAEKQDETKTPPTDTVLVIQDVSHRHTTVTLVEADKKAPDEEKDNG